MTGPERQDVADVAAVWDTMADGWTRHRGALARHTRPVSERMLALVDPPRAGTVLELCAGLGELSRRLADVVGSGGEVICSDVAPRMVAAAAAGSPTSRPLRFEVLDAQDLALGDDSVDAAVCKMGLMLLPDPAAALAEIRRVLRPGGAMVASTWGAPEDNPWILIFGGAMLTHGHLPPGDPTAAGGIFSLADPERLAEMITAAGFDDVEIEAVAAPEETASFDDYWDLRAATGGPLSVVLRRLAPDEVEAIRTTCRRYAAGLRQDDGSYRFPGRALVTVAR